MLADTLTIRDPHSRATATIAPDLGFNCFSFQAMLGGRPVEMLWQDPQFLSGGTRPSRSGIPILFPFAGRIRNAQYHYRGRDYELEAAEGQQGNAIHGFVYTRRWRLTACSESSITGEFQASLDDPSLLERWPADFRIEATYQVQRRSLLATYRVTNPGDTPLPWALGTHPYFRLALPDGSPAAAVVQFDVSRRWELAGSIPTGKVAEVPEAALFRRGVSVDEREFDDVFTGLARHAGMWSGTVRDRTSGHGVAIRFGEPFIHCVVFVPPHREAICLEPYSSTPNPFELLAQGIDCGFRELPPGEAVETHVEIEALEHIKA
jgi:aldose 1-epimerase